MPSIDLGIQRSRAVLVIKPSFRSRSITSAKKLIARQDQLVCHSGRDPLEGEIWKSWSGQEAEWETEKFAEDELVDILFEEDGSPETAAQNILALAFAFLLVLALGSILWRITIVSLALVSAAVRYSFVAILFLILMVYFL